jgi:hypothetical protein
MPLLTCLLDALWTMPKGPDVGGKEDEGIGTGN